MIRRISYPVLHVIVLGLVAITPAIADAQVCFRGKPLPDCKAFWVTDFTYANQIDETISRGISLMPEVGLMVNLNPKHAVGGSYFLDALISSAHPRQVRTGPKLKYRYWINQSFNVDLGVGVMLLRKPELAVEGFFNFRDWIGLGTRVEFWRDQFFNESNTAVYSALKVGGVPGATISTLLIVVGTLVVVHLAAAG